MNKCFRLITLGMCLLVGHVHSQDQKVVDSLNAVLTDKAGVERFPVLYELTFQYIQKDNERALTFIKEAEKAALFSGNSLWIVKSKRVKGQILYMLERADEARTALCEALPIAVEIDIKPERLQIEYTLAKLDLFQGKYDNALRLYFKSLELARGINDQQHIALTLHSIGITYYKLKDYAKGLNYFKQSLQARTFDVRESHFFLTNIGLCYAHLGDFFNARYYVDESLRDCGPDCSERSRINIEYAFGVIYCGEKNYGMAEKHFLTSYSFAQRTNNIRFQLDNIYLLSDIYIQQKRFDDAKFYLLAAEKLIRRHIPYNLEVIKIYSQFSDLYLALQDYKKAALYQSQYIQLKDSIYNEDFTNSLLKIEGEYLERQNQAKIEAQEQIILLNEEVIKRQEILNIVVFLLVLVFLIFLIFLLRNYRHKRNLNLLLAKRIKERTLELELSRDTLLKIIHEKDLRIDRALAGISKTMNTVNGLCAAGNLEISEPVGRSYINKIQKTFACVDVYSRSIIEEGALISLNRPI